MEHLFIKYRTIALLLFTCLFHIPAVEAQGYLANVQFYSHKNGLAGRFANCTFKDSRGLIWIGTQFGLNRFDGRDFLLFNEASGLPFSQVMEIHEDSEGWLWLFRNCFGKQSCTRNLAFLHSITHEIHTFEEHFGDSLDFGAEDVVSIVTNEKGDVFLSAKGQVIQWSEGKIRRKIVLTNLEATPNLLSVVGQNKLAAWYHSDDKTGNAFFAYLVFDLDGKIQHTQDIPNPKKNKSLNSLLLIGRDYWGRQMVGNEKFFEAAKPHFVLQADGKLLKDTSVWTTFPNPQDFFYNPFRLAAWQIGNDGPVVYTPSEGLVYRFSDEFPELGKDLFYRQIRFDENDVTWISGRYGLLRIQLKPNPFQRILYNPLSDLESPIKYICQGVIPVGDGKLLLSTQQGFFETKTGATVPPVKLEGNFKGGPVTLTKGYRGDYWGVHKEVLFGIKTDASNYDIGRQFFENQKNFHRILSQYFNGNRLWLGTEKGLHFFDHVQQQFFELAAYNGFDELKENTVHQIYQEKEDRLWLCTSGGLYLFSPERGILARYWQGGTGKFRIPGTAFYQILPARQGGWWLASQQGLVYWNPSENATKLFTTKEGLIANEILAVHEDDFGFLWLATNAGLVQFQISTGLSKDWLEADGVCSNDFEPYSYYCQEDGTVWFGSTNGYTVFHPKDFKDIDLTAKPDVPLNILDFEQFSIQSKKLANRTLQLLENQKITLQPGEQLFNLRIALADYVSGADAKYAYRIACFQDFWLEDRENLIRISGLPYGNFNLEIRGRLANGQYSSQEIHLPIQVLRPFYLKTGFLVLSILFFLISGPSYYLWHTSQLKKRQIQLEYIVEKRTEELQQDKRTIELQAKELHHLDKLKSRFFANVSHELRTPLTLILGPLSTVLSSNELSVRNHTYLLTMQENSKKLLRLISEILDLSKLESGKLDLQTTTVALYPLLRRWIATFESYAQKKQLAFSWNCAIDKALQLKLDASKFEVIFNNLLSNAFKFTPAEGKIHVEVEDLAYAIRLEVRDTGQGIHPDDLPHIFDRFYQTSRPEAAAEGGTGIGLALCMEFAKLFKGKLWVESELDRGSVFFFEFPRIEVLKSLPTATALEIQAFDQTDAFAVQTPEPKPLSATPAKDNDKATLLIVEDNPDLREYLETLLEEKYRVLTAENGRAALEVLSFQSAVGSRQSAVGSEQSGNCQLPTAYCQLIISDIMMPVMDGFQLLEKLKGDDRWRHLPVIMLTARAEMRDKLKALRIGVDDYMLKPFEEEELLARVENLLRNSRERQLAISSQQEDNETMKQWSNETITREDQQWLHDLEQLVKENVSNHFLNADFLSTKLATSRSVFFKRVKQLTGLSPNDYINEVRYNLARVLLENRTKTAVKAVAGAVGMKDFKYFSRQFKKRFGKLPSAYF